MPKKPPRNAFYFFMQDFKQRQEAKGVRFPGGLKDVAEAAGPEWRDIKPSIRAQYEQRAKDYKNQPHSVKKYTSLGENVADVQRRNQDHADAELRQREHISRMVAGAISNNSLLDTLFYLIDVNFYCETKDMFVVNEVAVLCFNIAGGVQMVYHTIVDPVFIPQGYASDATLSFEEHCFRLPPLENGEKDVVRILSNIVEFLQQHKEPDAPNPPVFTMPLKVPAVSSFLSQIFGPYEDLESFRVYELQRLFHAVTNGLKNAANEGLPTEQLALVQLQKDTFQYHSGLGCEFHEATEKYYNCCKARVMRWAYTILDFCCPLANVEMEPGDHLPVEIDTMMVAQVKSRLEEERERAQVKVNPDFQWVNHAEMPQSAAESGDDALDSSAWPTLGGPRTKSNAAASLSGTSVWGKPATSAAAAPKRTPLRKPTSTMSDMSSLTIDEGKEVIGVGRGRGSGSAWGFNN